MGENLIRLILDFSNNAGISKRWSKQLPKTLISAEPRYMGKWSMWISLVGSYEGSLDLINLMNYSLMNYS